jgi:hypothetical protein
VLAAKDSASVVHLQPHFFAPQQGLRERAERDKAPYDLCSRPRQGPVSITSSSPSASRTLLPAAICARFVSTAGASTISSGRSSESELRSRSRRTARVSAT